MRILLIAFCGLIAFVGCRLPNKKRQVKFDAFDFTYSDVFSTCFSIKFTTSDTVYFQQYFVGDNKDSLKESRVYVGQLNNREVSRLDSFLNSTDLYSFDSTYLDQMQDGLTFGFFISNDQSQKRITVHAEKPPKQLDDFARWLADMKLQLQLRAKDSTISFGSARYVLPPIVDPPPIENVKKRKH